MDRNRLISLLRTAFAVLLMIGAVAVVVWVGFAWRLQAWAWWNILFVICAVWMIALGFVILRDARRKPTLSRP